MRSVEGKLIQIPCNQGNHQETHPRLSPTGTFAEVYNMRVNGAGILQKRYGTRAIGNNSTGTPTFTSAGTSADPAFDPAFISRVGGSGLVGRTDGSIFAHIDDTSGSLADALCVQGRFSTCIPVRKRFGIMAAELGSDVGFGANAPAVAVNSAGYILVAAVANTTSNDLLYAYIESPEGVRVWVKKIDNANVLRVQALAVGASFVLVWQIGTALTAQVITVDGTFSVTSGAVTSVLFSGGYWDTTAYDGTYWYVGFNADAGATNVITVQKMSGVALVTSTDVTIVGTAGNAIAPMSLYGDTSNARIWVGWVDEDNDVKYAVLNATTMASVLTATTIQNQSGTTGPPLFGPDTLAASTARFIYFHNRNALERRTFSGTVTDSGTVTTIGTHKNLVCISKPDSEHRFWAITDMNPSNGNFLFSRVVLMRLPVDHTATLATLELASPRMPWITDTYSPTQDPGFFHAIADGPSSSFFAFPFVLTTVGDDPLVKIEVYEYEAAADHPHRAAVPSAQTTYIAGQPVEVYAQPMGTFNLNGTNSTLARYEGAAEVGFVETPCITSAASSGGGSGVAAGTYSYRVVFQWEDAYGRRHRSAPSPPCELVLSVARNVSLDISECQITQRASTLAPYTSPRAIAYRTTNGGTTYHRLPGNGFTVSSTDNNSDASIADEEILYTDGNVLENDLAPSCRFMRYVQGRLWCGGLWDPAIIECSKLDVPTEQIAFTGDASHQVVLPDGCSGLAVMDDQLVVFTEDVILTVVGEGPNDQGIGSFATRTVSVGIGCVDYRSIAETDVGVIFLSRLGFYLLPRGFGVPQYIGAAIQDSFEDYPTCLAAGVWNGNGSYLARFLMAAASGGTRVTFDYDVNGGQWYISTYAQNNDELGVWPSGWVLCAGDLDRDTTPRPLLVEDTSKVADAVHASSTGSHIEQKLTTNWINPAGPGAWANVSKVMGTVIPIANSSLTIAAYQDTTSNVDTQTWSVSSGEVAYRYVVPTEHHSVSFRISMYDAAVSGVPSRGMQFHSITLESDTDGGVRPHHDGEQK